MIRSNAKWFFGVIDQPGIWAISSERPGVAVKVGDYPCRQLMSPCWVAYLGPVPTIAMPDAVNVHNVVGYLNQDTLPPDPRTHYYADKDLADIVVKLFDTSSLVETLKEKIRARAKTTA